MRPVLRVVDNNLLVNMGIINKISQEKLKWEDLLTDARCDNSIIEYIDASEQNLSMIAMQPSVLENNHGNYVASLANLCRWLATQAEDLGVEI